MGIDRRGKGECKEEEKLEKNRSTRHLLPPLSTTGVPMILQSTEGGSRNFLKGGRTRGPSRVQELSPGRGPGVEVPQKLKQNVKFV